MSDPDIPIQPQPQIPTVDPSDQIRILRTALIQVIVAMFLLTGTFFIYLYREVILVRRQSDELARMVLEYQKTALPQLQEFKAKLHSYSKTNPSFAPIYGKYFGTNAPESGPNLDKLPAPPSPVP